MDGKFFFSEPKVRQFLSELGVTQDPLTETEAFIKKCDGLNELYKTKGLIRTELQLDRTKPEYGVELATLALARRLGMRHGETAVKGGFDVVIALGGANLAPLHRLSYAVQAIVEGRASAELLVIAGSTRPIKPIERPFTDTYAPGAETEYDLCVAAAKRVAELYPQVKIMAVKKDNSASFTGEIIDEVMIHCKSIFGNKKLKVAGVTTQIYVRDLNLTMGRASKRHDWYGFLAAGHATDPWTVLGRSVWTYLSQCLTVCSQAARAAAEGC